jgi:cell shape-determining protein MreC
MLLRICLVLAILAGLGVIGLTQFKIRPKMLATIQERDFNKTKWTEFEGKFKKSQRDLKETQETLTKTTTELEDTKTALTAATAKADEQQKRADVLRQTLDQTKIDLTTAQQGLAAWTALGIPVNEVSALYASERNLRSANEALELEKQILNKEITRQSEQIRLILHPDAPVPLPRELKGRVIAVDPKWDFVVLDIGFDQGARQNGVMMIGRDSKLIGKVRLTNVQPNRSIANIIQGWKIGEVTEGDMVLVP